MYSELYLFSYKGDSLFLNVNEILSSSGTRMNRIYITKIAYLYGDVAAVLKPAGFYDTDGDGNDELYFSISSAFQLGPRRMYYYDLAHGSLKSSQFSGSICLEPKMADTDGDNRPEIFGTMSASGNYSRNVPYSDSSTWLMVFDDKLNFEFPPVEFPGFANGLYTLPYENDRFKGYVLTHMANGADTTVLKSRIMIFSGDGKLIRNRLYSNFSKTFKYPVFVIRSSPSDRIYLFGNKLFELNASLEVINAASLPFETKFFPFQADVNGDRKDEFLFYSPDEKKVAVYDANLRQLSDVNFYTDNTQWEFYPYLSSDHQYKLFVSSGKDGYFLKINRNGFYLIAYLLYPAIYFSIFFFIVLIKRIGSAQLKAKENLNNRLLTLQLQGIKAQLDPHFTFNTLNSIASLIYLEDRQTAYDYMRKFTQLLRSMLKDAEKIYRNLGEEIEFVTTYLELEKLRFGEKFNYEIEIGEGVTKLEQVPKLVLQTFTENAVKHGIMPSLNIGIIKISVVREKDYLRITIEDNGVGRKHSSGHSESTGKGLKLTGEFYEILNHLNKKPIRHLITDLYNDSGDPAGTRVEVWVPLNEFVTPIK
jgi:two-component sensor histidine kinase